MCRFISVFPSFVLFPRVETTLHANFVIQTMLSLRQCNHEEIKQKRERQRQRQRDHRRKKKKNEEKEEEEKEGEEE